MSEELAHDDQSHYEISLTAGQAFVAFVLLLLSLSASFAFGLMIGKGQADERLVVQKETPVVTEGSAKKAEARIVELGVADTDFQAQDDSVADPAVTASAETASVVDAAPAADAATVVPEPVVAEPVKAEPVKPEPAVTPVQVAPQPRPAATTPAPRIPHYAQLLSTADQKTAESLAARLIDRGFTTAYVERGSNEKGTIYRVRVRFPSEADARAAENRLKEFSKDVWITK